MKTIGKIERMSALSLWRLAPVVGLLVLALGSTGRTVLASDQGLDAATDEQIGDEGQAPDRDYLDDAWDPTQAFVPTPGFSNAGPGLNLIVPTASTNRAVFQTTGSNGNLRLCITNRNAFSSATFPLLPLDAMTFDLPSGCLTLSTGACSVVVTQTTGFTPILSSDFGCVISTPRQVIIQYAGAAKYYKAGDQFCVDLVATVPAMPASCAMEFQFSPRAATLTALGVNWKAYGQNRVWNPSLPAFFTLDVVDPLSGPVGPTGATGPQGPQGPQGPGAPSQAGIINISALNGSGATPFSVNFAPAFSAVPVVTLGVETSYGWAARSLGPIVTSRTNTGFTGEVVLVGGGVVAVSGNNDPDYFSLAVVNGNPAISYLDDTNNDLKYVRASDASGTAWGTPVTIDSVGTVGLFTSLAVVNGNPAISYWDGTNNDLKYVRASDASGTAWGTPVTIDSVGVVGFYTSLAVVNGNPAISYQDSTNSNLKYVRASDASGTAWGTGVTIDSVGNVGRYTSLAVVNGNPAISYWDDTNGDLKYVRASDASGTAWGTPVTIDSVGVVGENTSLAVVNGNPAISYHDFSNADLKYVRASDASGTAWGTPITPDSVGSVGSSTSLAVVNGNPAISYWDGTNYDLKYVRASDASGTAWGTPITPDSVGNVGSSTSLEMVNGEALICYLDQTSGRLVKCTRTDIAFTVVWAAVQP